MKEFKIEYSETYSGVYDVEAESFEEAKAKLEEDLIENQYPGLEMSDSGFVDVTDGVSDNGRKYIVYGREGTELIAPKVFGSYDEAENHIKEEIASLIMMDFNLELEEAGINLKDTDAVLEWGEDNDYCDSDTYMYSSDWTEYKISEFAA